MEYITVENHIITGHYASDSIPEGAIPVTDFIGRVGEPVSQYNPDWSRKSDIELMLSGLMTIPNGYKITNTGLIEMSLKEKIDAGLETIPTGKKLDENETAFVDMSDDEKMEAGILSQEEYDQIQNARIIADLFEIDVKTIRSIRAILSGVFTEEDKIFLADMEKKAIELRKKLK